MGFFWVVVIIVIIFFIMGKKDNSKKKENDLTDYPFNPVDEANISVVSFSSESFGSKIKANARWIHHGKSIKVVGYTIPGMVYIGKPSENMYSMYSIDPSLLNPKLPVDKDHLDIEGRNIGYSYSDMPPENRAAYLEWLSEGRKNPDIDIEYVSVFFFGLERRLLIDSEKGIVSDSEEKEIIEEINRLLELYGAKGGSFSYFAINFLDFIKIKKMSCKAKAYELSPRITAKTYEMPLLIKLALGQLYVEKKPISVEWAYTYMMCDAYSCPLRTPIPVNLEH